MDINLYSQPKKSLTYWELVRKKFFRKPYAVIGTFVVISIIILGIFAPFFSPYSPTRTDRERQYFPPQTLHFFDQEGNFHPRPFVYGITEEMDPNTYEFSFIFLLKANRGIFWVLI